MPYDFTEAWIWLSFVDHVLKSLMSATCPSGESTCCVICCGEPESGSCATVVVVFFFAMVVAGAFVVTGVTVVGSATIEVVDVVVITVVDAVVKLVIVATAIVVSWTDCVVPHADSIARAIPSVRQE